MAAEPRDRPTQELPVPALPRLRRSLTAVLVGAALLVPVAPVVPASAAPSTHAAAARRTAERATRVSLAAYGDADGSGRVHLTGALTWSNGRSLGHQQQVELWGRTGTRWSLVRRARTDRAGDVELSVRPEANTTYRLRYAGSRSRALSSPARASTSPTLTVHALARVTLEAPATVKRGERFVIRGTVLPAGVRRVTVLGGRTTFTTLTTRPDGTFSGHVRLQTTTTLSVVLPGTSTLDEAVSGPRRVRVR